MSRISDTFRTLVEKKQGAYIPYVCAGDPDIEFTTDLIKSLCAAGADIIELGIPFSDPMADGPTIQAAMTRALVGGFRTQYAFTVISTLRASGVCQPIVVMTYANPMIQMGVEQFCSRLVEAGGDGLLVVDLPPEESSEVDTCAARLGLDVIRLVTPTSSDDRLKMLVSRASGYAYAVSVAGVTGARESVNKSGLDLVQRVSSMSPLPVVLGFGISRPEHVRAALRAGAAGVVEGSQLIPLYIEQLSADGPSLDLLLTHSKEMKAACLQLAGNQH